LTKTISAKKFNTDCAMVKDDITIELSERLKAFLNFFNEKLHSKVLEIDTNAKSADYYQHLIRVSSSLEQYVKKDVSLFYIGFLGSYSSGKSSTINSILGLWHTDKARRTSNNPTDDTITLITNQKNVSNVFNFAKEGAISIRTDTNFDCDLLEKIVLMDTPGSGDPNIVASIVRDSLPLCDLIVYTLNATTPFTDIDKPFLIQQQKKLKNIPILFVLTRADEFKKNSEMEVSENNFDERRYLLELQTTIARINEAVSITNFLPSDFLIIDNKSSFRTCQLKERLKSLTGNGEESLIILHNHKLSYFNNEVEAIKRYYLDLTEDKIVKCAKFVEKAGSNADYFDKQIEISKTKYRVIWNEYAQKLNRVYDGTIKGYIDGLVDDLKIIQPFIKTGVYYQFREGLVNKLNVDSEIKASEIMMHLEKRAFESITSFKQELMDLINYESLSLEFNFEDDKWIDFSVPFSFPISCADVINNFYYSFDDVKTSAFSLVNKTAEQFYKSLSVTTPLESIQKIINDYKTAAIDVLDLYYQAIKMYKIAVFSYELKRYTADLGLADKFDEIESKELDKTKYNLLAENELLQDFDIDSNVFITNVQAIASELKMNNDDVPTLEPGSNRIEMSQFDVVVSDDRRWFASSEQFINNSFREMISTVQSKLFELRLEMKQMARKRRRRHLLSILLPAFLVPVIYLLYNKFRHLQTPTNLWMTLLISVGTGLISTFILKLTDQFKNRKKNLIEKFKVDLYGFNAHKLDELYATFREKNAGIRKDLHNQIYSVWKADLERLLMTLNNSINEEERILTSKKEDVLAHLERYREIYSRFHDRTQRFFCDYESNILKIGDITSKIKEESIKPSFDLLSVTLDEIKGVREQIEITLSPKSPEVIS
jgi:predicted GTPase